MNVAMTKKIIMAYVLGAMLKTNDRIESMILFNSAEIENIFTEQSVVMQRQPMIIL